MKDRFHLIFAPYGARSNRDHSGNRLSASVLAGGLLLVVSICLLSGQAASANTVYTYTGNPYTDVLDGPSIPGSYSTTMFISGTVTLSGALGSNLSYYNISSGDIAAYSFDDGRGDVLTQDNSTINMGAIYTDSHGTITQWSLRIGTTLGPNKGDMSYSIESNNIPYYSNNIDKAGITLCVESGSGSYCPAATYEFAENFGSPGTWTSPIANATPLPAAGPLFATGLGALGLLGWRRKKKSAALAA